MKVNLDIKKGVDVVTNVIQKGADESRKLAAGIQETAKVLKVRQHI